MQLKVGKNKKLLHTIASIDAFNLIDIDSKEGNVGKEKKRKSISGYSRKKFW